MRDDMAIYSLISTRQLGEVNFSFSLPSSPVKTQIFSADIIDNNYIVYTLHSNILQPTTNGFIQKYDDRSICLECCAFFFAITDIIECFTVWLLFSKIHFKKRCNASQCRCCLTIEGSNTIQYKTSEKKKKFPVIRLASNNNAHLLGYSSDDLDTVYNRVRDASVC